MLQTFTIPSPGRQIDAKASFFRYESGNAAGADESLRVYADGQDLGTYLPGDAVRLPVTASRWIITPVSPALVSTVRLGIASVESARLVGVVRVIDESTAKTSAGRQGYVYHRRIANAAKCSMAGIITTAPLSIKRLSVFQPTAGLVQMFTGTGPPTDTVSNNPNGLQNKLIASGYLTGATRVTALCAGTTPTGVELPGVAYAGALQVPAGVLTEHILTTPIILGAGVTFVAVGGAINTEVGLYLDAEEFS